MRPLDRCRTEYRADVGFRMSLGHLSEEEGGSSWRETIDDVPHLSVRGIIVNGRADGWRAVAMVGVSKVVRLAEYRS
jgi:hypothetical protein